MQEARSISEARLFMEHEPCPSCGHRGFGHPRKIVAIGERVAAAASGYCPSCGTERKFELLLGDERVPEGAFGNRAPSTLIDAGEWLAIADAYGALVPAEIETLDARDRELARTNLAKGIAAVEEVLKFVPAGADEPPRSAFFTSRGLDVYLAAPVRFKRARLDVLLDAWRELAESFVEN